MLGVPRSLIADFGAVSEAVAVVDGRRRRREFAGGFAVAVTGIAGPGGGTGDKPVGLVHIAAVSRRQWRNARSPRFGDIGRTEMRLKTIEAALTLLLEIFLKGLSARLEGIRHLRQNECEGITRNRAQKAVLEVEGDGKIHAARLPLGREMPMGFQLTERPFGLRHIDCVRGFVQHDAAGVAFAESAKPDQHFRAKASQPSKCWRERTRTPTHQGRNSGYFSTSATIAYMCAAEYRTILLSE